MLKPGDPFERYAVEALLGQGGMGAVYRAFDPKLGRRVALKVISEGTATAEADARLIREARAAAALDHPNAVSIFDVGEHEGAPYIVMELVEGHTLRSAVGASLPLPVRLSQLADVAKALAGAHRRGLVHRDIKPENVMVRDDGMVKVLDFGIARRTGGAGVDPHAVTETPALPTLTVDGVKLGTPVYMAPEQIRGDELDGRADQFSWGVLAYELCAGRLPWRGANDPMAVMASVLTDPIDPAPLAKAGVSPAVQSVLLCALQKRREDRFASMDDLFRSLQAAIDGAPLPADKAVSKPPGATEAQRFSTGEIREVLGKAVEAQAAKDDKLGFDDLLAVAAEMGIDPEALREASRVLRARSTPAPEPAPAPTPPPAALAPVPASPGGLEIPTLEAWLRQQKLMLYRHAGVYAIINAALLVLGLVLLSWTHWWIWFIPPLAWGVGLAIHALTVMTASEAEYKEHVNGLRWWHERGRRRHEERMAAINSFGAGRRQRRRVEAFGPPPEEVERERLRVAPPTAPSPMDTGRERAAEEEAVEAERREGRRRRR